MLARVLRWWTTIQTYRSKYHNKKITVGGRTFDSKKEAARYGELLLLERDGLIKNLDCQVKFQLIPAQRINGKVKERACTYIADFVYEDEDGNKHVEDVKGYKGGVAYSVFTIKRNLMLYVHGIVVEEI